jgi:hypothetical protein
MWTYKQTTGELIRDGHIIGTGYSGSPEDENNPAKQSVHDEGPIPEGTYTISRPLDTVTHGPHVMVLTPDVTNEMFGRRGFLLHGDSISHPGCASEGCIIMSRQIREMVSDSGDRRLQVIA